MSNMTNMTKPAHSRRDSITNSPVNTALHPAVYRMILALLVLFLFSMWLFFGGAHYIVLTLGVITFLLAFSVGIPALLLKKFEGHATQADHLSRKTFRVWTTQRFRSWTESLTGSAATVQILLPIGAVAFGMTMIGLVYSLTSVPHLS